eukprot:SAG31_NODE_23_length_33717_cov_17.863585_15_plen_262_part_00
MSLQLYCTGPAISKADSDTVFYTKHIDGPYGMIPFASLYRCIMASDSNTQISTIFPMTGQYITAADGDAVCFDFHRENHFIQSDNTRRNQDLRVVLKLHYVVYPKWARPIGQLMHYLSVKYNENFRALFLFTIQPKTIVARITAWNVVFWTVVVEKTWTHVGLQVRSWLLLVDAAVYCAALAPPPNRAALAALEALHALTNWPCCVAIRRMSSTFSLSCLPLGSATAVHYSWSQLPLCTQSATSRPASRDPMSILGSTSVM